MWRESHSCNHSTMNLDLQSKSRSEAGYEGRRFLDTRSNGILWRTCNDVNSRSNQGKYTATIFKEQENEKKRKYNQRVMNVEMGTFTPLMSGTNRSMGLNCQNFLRTLANTLSTKNNEPYASVISWLRMQLSFAILRTVHRCVRGSRYPFKSREVSEDFTFAVAGLHVHSKF